MLFILVYGRSWALGAQLSILVVGGGCYPAHQPLVYFQQVPPPSTVGGLGHVT